MWRKVVLDFEVEQLKRRQGGVYYQMLLHCMIPSAWLRLLYYQLKVFFRNFVGCLGRGWDEDLPEQVLKSWKAWQSNFRALTSVKLPRCYKPADFKDIKSIELHHFADASVSRYGTASYLRFIDAEDRIHCSLVMGKATVAPLKTITVPRLELTTATLAVKVNKQLRGELQLPINKVVLWIAVDP